MEVGATEPNQCKGVLMNYEALDVGDRQAIQDLFSLYGFLIDDGRVDEWIALFTPDGIFDAPGVSRFVGHDQLRDIAAMVIAGSQGRWRHQLTNVLAEPGAEADTARVRMNGLVTDWSQDPAGTSFMDYSATLLKVAGRWRIREIVAIPTKVTV